MVKKYKATEIGTCDDDYFSTFTNFRTFQIA